MVARCPVVAGHPTRKHNNEGNTVSLRVVGLLSWYEEHPGWLVECVASAARLCDHIIAVDGPYGSFPGSTRKPFSGTEQSDAILRTAAGFGMGCTIHSPRQPWWGGEVQKRDFMFKLGSTFATSGTDWFLRIDADEVLTQVPEDTKTVLAATEHDVGEVILWERDADSVKDYDSPLRCLFRALPNIGVEQAHYVVTAHVDGARKVLSGNPSVHNVAPVEPLWDVRLEHRTRLRPNGRRQLKQEYAAAADQLEHVEPFQQEESA